MYQYPGNKVMESLEHMEHKSICMRTWHYMYVYVTYSTCLIIIKRKTYLMTYYYHIQQFNDDIIISRIEIQY